jgi:hypothetical protein
MSLSTLSKTDLWIVPPSSHSAWFAQLDWYLNWQMCKGLTHKPATVDAEVYRLAQAYEVPVSSPKIAKDAPLLIACRGLSPAGQCLVLPYTGDLKQWLLEAKTIAFKMKCENVQVFLPADASADKAEKTWIGLNGECRAEFINDFEGNS